MSIRRVTAALALITACVTSSVAVANSADAAVRSSTSPQVAPNTVFNHRGNLSEVAVTTSGVNATAIGAISEVSYFGHMQFFGPKGWQENSPGGERQFNAGQGGAVPIDPPRLAAAGSLWCVRLWQYNGSPGNYTDLEQNCVTVP